MEILEENKIFSPLKFFKKNFPSVALENPTATSIYQKKGCLFHG